MESAWEWGQRHHSCSEALELRKALGPNKTQADWWRACERGDWLIWQLWRMPESARGQVCPALDRALEKIVLRAVTNHALHCGVPTVEVWATKWISGEDRTAASAASAASAARAARAESAASAEELKLQAADIRVEIPEWPGGVETLEDP